jgi:N6-adenosine-specific RNA methylase IME4/ParB-like chromosome segregation protein Spo0J
VESHDQQAKCLAEQALAAIELPPASAEERAALKESIAAEGLLVPVVVSAGPARAGEVADGQARVELCAELGIPCASEQRAFASEAEFQLYRLLTNLKRRQLPPAQLIRIGLALEPLERAQAAARKAQGRGKPRGEKALPVALPEEKGETRELVARKVGLKPSSYARGAKVLREGSPALVAAFEAGRETVHSAHRRLRAEQRRGERLALAERLERQPLPLPSGRFPVVVLDPPWPEQGELPYPTQSLDEIAALSLTELLSEDASVWLWTTNRFLFEAEAIGRERWGLERRGVLTWAKDRLGTGFPLRGQTEQCLLFSQGKPLFLPGNASTLLTGPVREHSRKPEEFYELVEALCPGAKLELFARERRPGWQVWGAETERFPARSPDEEEAA